MPTSNVGFCRCEHEQRASLKPAGVPVDGGADLEDGISYLPATTIQSTPKGTVEVVGYYHLAAEAQCD